GDDAYRTDGERRQGQAGLTRVEDEVGHDVDRLGGEVEVLDGVLDGNDVRVLGEPGEGVDLDPPPGATGDVVEHHRLADVGDGPEVGDQALLGGTVVIGGHREDGVGSGLRRLLGQRDRVTGVVGAGAGHDERVLLLHRVDDCVIQGDLLVVVQGG